VGGSADYTREGMFEFEYNGNANDARVGGESPFYMWPKCTEVLSGIRLRFRNYTLYTLSACSVTMRTPSSHHFRFICFSVCTPHLVYYPRARESPLSVGLVPARVAAVVLQHGRSARTE
jgi:hypothetical protein